MGDSELTLEETNKVRISLGLQPLADPSAPLAEGEEPELDADQEAEANYARRREADEKAAETKCVQLLSDALGRATRRRMGSTRGPRGRETITSLLPVLRGLTCCSCLPFPLPGSSRHGSTSAYASSRRGLALDNALR